ncbi:MAG TPA: hypothetical protein VIX87_10780 [Steroidobacteraceae bacterium]
MSIGKCASTALILLAAGAALAGAPAPGAPAQPGAGIDQAGHADQADQGDQQQPADICAHAEDCQRVFDSETRDEPWSSRMEQELRSFFSEQTDIAVSALECRRSLCSLVAATRAPSIHPWAYAVEEMHAMPWYAEFFSDTGSATGPPAVEITPGLWVPKPGGVVAIRWFLERRPPVVQ